MIYEELSTNGQIIYSRVEGGSCDLAKLTAAKTKCAIDTVEFNFIKGVFGL